MARKEVIYRISMDEIREAGENGPDSKIRGIARLRDRDYRIFFIKRALVYLFLALFASAFLLLLSASTSPLYREYCDGDSSIFMVVGKGITQGRQLYTDLFDHKGPILFYLNALGFLINGSKTGVFIVQCVFLSLTSVFMFKTARIFTKTFRSVVCVLITVLAFAATISDGNLSEEYCMLFCVIAIYFAIKFYARCGGEPHPPLYCAVYGACFAACAFVRVNNGVMIGGAVLVALVNEFATGRIKSALKNLAAFFIGFAAVAVPICAFFAINGNFSEMIFATFTFNFLYAAEGAEQAGAHFGALILWAAPTAALIIVTVIFSKRLGARVASLITAVSVFALIPALMGFSYNHYYTTLIPLISLYCAVFFFIATRRVTFWSALLCIIMVLPLYGYFVSLPENIGIYRDKLQSGSDTHSEIYESAEAISALIPEDERGEVFGYKVEAAWFLQADITPCFRLFTLQEAWADHYPEFAREINRMMVDNPPKWLVIRYIDNVGSRQFVNIVHDKYDVVSEYGFYELYRRRGSTQ